MSQPITAHQLARLLLTLPDDPVAFVDGDGEGQFIGYAQVAESHEEESIIELLSIRES